MYSIIFTIVTTCDVLIIICVRIPKYILVCPDG